MKLIIKFIIIILTVAVVMGGAFWGYENFSEHNALKQEVLNQLVVVSSSKANRVKSFLDERKIDAEILAETDDVKNVFIKKEISNDIDSILDQEQIRKKIDYQVSEILAEELVFFQKTNGYLDLILINTVGEVIWTAAQKMKKGINIETGKYKDTILADLFKNVKKDLGVGISDPEYLEEGGRLSIFVTMPVLETDNRGKRVLQGVIALQIDNEKILELISSDVGVQDIGEIYVVNRDRHNITQLKFNHQLDSKKTSSVNSDQIDRCFEDYDNYYIDKSEKEISPVSKSGIYENYTGRSVFGAHEYILQSGWCVISELYIDDYYSSLPSFFERYY